MIYIYIYNTTTIYTVSVIGLTRKIQKLLETSAFVMLSRNWLAAFIFRAYRVPD